MVTDMVFHNSVVCSVICFMNDPSENLSSKIDLCSYLHSVRSHSSRFFKQFIVRFNKALSSVSEISRSSPLMHSTCNKRQRCSLDSGNPSSSSSLSYDSNGLRILNVLEINIIIVFNWLRVFLKLLLLIKVSFAIKTNTRSREYHG